MASIAELPSEPRIHESNIEPQVSNDGALKRKASPEVAQGDDSPKRAKLEDEANHEDGEIVTNEGEKSPQNDRRANQGSIERRQSATQEEKKRSRRLFGGLLNTLSQAPSNSQQKRRQEIERRQHERMQRQDVEDGKKRAERLSRLRKVRMAAQIVFDEEVMKKRHEKMLSLARFLSTRSRPRIYYMPWKRTAEQEIIIERQIQRTKAQIAREKAEFEQRREMHIRKAGPSRQARPESPKRPPVNDTVAPDEANSREEEEGKRAADSVDKQEVEEGTGAAATAERDIVDRHDDAGDVMEEGDEDVVIY